MKAKPALLIAAIASLAAALPILWPFTSRADNGECVVLLHGLGRTPTSMKLLGRRLRQQGYRVVNIGYPSRHATRESLASNVAARIEAACADSGETVHFVGHSLGATLALDYVSQPRPIRPGRIVLLCPPNHGSEVVDTFRGLRAFRFAVGPAGLALGTNTMASAATPPPNVEIGVITGDRSINPILSSVIPGPDDGKVSVASAQLPGMADFLVLHATHTFLMQRRDAARQIVSFLRRGAFERKPQAAPDFAAPIIRGSLFSPLFPS